MLNTQYVTLSMIPSGVMPVLYCSQYDVGRPLGFVVNNGSEVVNLDQYMVAIEGTRSDGTGIVADVTTDGNIGVFLTTATMTNKSDIYDMQLVIRSTDTHHVASIPFMMNVRIAALDENSSVIEEDKSLFQQYTETVMIALAEIRTDVESEATARSNADSALLEKINIEAADRAAEDAALNDRIDNIIAPGGAPSAAEVTDARLGADGVLYDTLGEAIRTQFDDVYKNLAYTVHLESDISGLLVVNGGIGGTVPTALTATLEPQQTGAGAPSADNIRPFVQFTSLSMLHAGESGGGGSGNPPTMPFWGGTQNCITGEWTLYQYNSNYDGIGDMTDVRWWSDRDVYVPGTNPSVGAYVVYEPTTPMRSSGQAWGAEAMYSGINQYKMLAYDSVTHTTVPFALTIEADVANVGAVVNKNDQAIETLQSDMDQTNQALTLLRNEYDITASTVVTHTTLIENNTEDIEENTADIAENAQEISLVKSHIGYLTDDILNNKLYFPNYAGKCFNSSAPDYDSINIATPTANASWNAYLIPCQDGDTFTVFSVGGLTVYAWAFVDSSGDILSRSTSNATANGELVTAPQNAVYLVVNDKGGASRVYQEQLVLVKDAITLFDTDCSRHLPLEWLTHGDFNTTTGVPRNNNTYRVCSLRPLSYDRPITFVPDSGWRIYISLVNNGVLSAGSWKTSAYTIDAGQQFCCTIARATEDTSEIADMAVFSSHITINSAYDWIERYLSPIFPGQYGIPDFDTVNKILTIPLYCTVYWKSGFYTFSSGTTVDYSGGNSAARKILFNPETKALFAVDYNVFMPDMPVIALIQTGGTGYNAGNISISCPYTVNGIRYGNNGSMASVFPCVNGIPNINTANKTLTIKAPTSIFWEGGYYLLQTDTVIDLTEYQYDAKKVVFDVVSHTFSTVQYSNISPTKILIALIQFSGSAFIGAAMSCDYSVNGVRYGIDQSGYRQYNVESIGHRGYNTVAPENTLPAFRLSKIHNFDWIETDVQFTSDDVPVILHDQSINRTARNADGTTLDATVNIDDITYEQALEYDFGIWKGAEYAGTKIPSFDQCIALCRNIGLKARIELKSETVTTSKISTLVDIVRKYGMLENVEWISSSLTLLQYISANYPSFHLGYIVGTISATVITNTIALRTSQNEVRISAEISNLTDALVALVSAEDIPLDVWTVSTNTQVLNAPVYASTFTSNLPHAGEVLYNANIA